MRDYRKANQALTTSRPPSKLPVKTILIQAQLELF